MSRIANSDKKKIEYTRGESPMSTDNTFPALINRYISELGCTAKELAYISGISETLLSRYRSGQRVPTEEQVAKIVKGIAALDHAKQFEEAAVLKELTDVGISLPRISR